MKSIIYYYSGSGNTKLACQYLDRHIPDVSFEFKDATDINTPRLEAYDLVGFATFTDFSAPPYKFREFLEKIPPQEGTPAFVFNTYGSFSGKTLKKLAQMAQSKGFKVIAGYSLHTPESYPPLNALGVTSADAPSVEELETFNNFIDHLASKIQTLQAGGQVEAASIQLDFLNRLVPALPRTTSRRLMKDKYVDTARCTKCGLCAEICPYDAIALDPHPVFDEVRCYGCWACYNHCPERAIYTKRYKDVGHYSKPNEQLRQKLGA